MTSLVDQWIAEGEARGIEQGIERGIEQGIEQGLIQGLKKNIIQILAERLGTVPQSVQDAINAKCDKIALQSLFQTALHAQSFDEFNKEL